MNYTSPGAGLPAPDPFSPAAKPDWRKKKRKRYNPKNPWYHAYNGDAWRKPHARETYRIHIENWRGMKLCRVTCHRNPMDIEGSMKINAVFRIAAPHFKRLAVDEGLRPVPRPAKYRHGMCIDFWDWPAGFVKD